MSRFVLDCAVSRPISERVAGWYSSAALRAWARPQAGYHEGKQSSMLLEQARTALTRLVDARNVAFCPDIGSAVAAAVAGAVTAAVVDPVSVATTAVDPLEVQAATERAASAAQLAHHVLEVDSEGRVDLVALGGMPTPAILVTSLGNQEIGTVQADLTAWAQATGSALVLDASTAFGWIAIPSGWSHLVLDAPAWGGVPGAVAVCSNAAVASPTENVPAAVVAALTAETWLAQAPDARVTARRQINALRERVLGEVEGVEVRGGRPEDLPHVLSISVLYVDAQALQTQLDIRGYAVGSGSACASRQGQPSHVLAAVGGFTGGNLRLGLPPDLPDEVVAGFADALVEVVHEVRTQMGTQDL